MGFRHVGALLTNGLWSSRMTSRPASRQTHGTVAMSDGCCGGSPSSPRCPDLSAVPRSTRFEASQASTEVLHSGRWRRIRSLVDRTGEWRLISSIDGISQSAVRQGRAYARDSARLGARNPDRSGWIRFRKACRTSSPHFSSKTGETGRSDRKRQGGEAIVSEREHREVTQANRKREVGQLIAPDAKRC